MPFIRAATFLSVLPIVFFLPVLAVDTGCCRKEARLGYEDTDAMRLKSQELTNYLMGVILENQKQNAGA